MKITVPAALTPAQRPETIALDDQGAVTLAELFQRLESRFDGIQERLLTEAGELRGYVAVYVNGQDVRRNDGMATLIESEDEVKILPALSGG